MARPLTPAELADLLRSETHAQSKPPPVTLGSVLVGVLQSIAAGIGAALLVGGVLWVLQAPAPATATAPAKQSTALDTAGALAMGPEVGDWVLVPPASGLR